MKHAAAIPLAFVAVALGVFVAAPAVAQTSASYKVQEAAFNNGGDPRSGGAPASAHFHLSLDAIGDGGVRAGLGSASYHADGGFVGRYGPPGAVSGLLFSDQTTLQWTPEHSAAWYEVYRAPFYSLPGNFGSCFASNLPAQTATTASDPALPAAGQGFFYFVTARNSLREEGPKGFGSDGTMEGNPLPCP